MQAVEAVRRLGGVATRAEAVRLGTTPSRLFTAVGAGELLRPRKGWYCLPHLDSRLVESIRVGGRAACSTAAAATHGLWDLGDARLHVAVPRRASRLRTPDDKRVRLNGRSDVVVHWSRQDPDGNRLGVPVEEALLQVLACHGPDAAFVLLESALHRRLLSGSRPLTSDWPRDLRWMLERAGHSESGAESMLKLMLLRRRIPFRQQVVFDGIGRVDFLIGDRLVVEVDSIAHHSTPTADRARDAKLSTRGVRVLRFMYSQIVHEPELVLAAILAAIARGDHRR